MYFNDRYYPLLGVQLGFAIADDMCLLMRWFDVLPGAQVGLRVLHVYFNIGIETGTQGWSEFLRGVFFLMDDLISSADLLIMSGYSNDKTSRRLWTKRQIVAAVVASALSIIIPAILVPVWSTDQRLT